MGVGVVRAGRVAPRGLGLECRGARVAKLPSELQRGANRVVLCGLESECFAPAGCDSQMHANFFPWWWRWWGDDLGSVLEGFSFSASEVEGRVKISSLLVLG